MQWRDITAVGPTKKYKLSLGPCLIILMIDSILIYYSPQGLRKLRPFFPKKVTRGNRLNQVTHNCLQNTHPFGHTLLAITEDLEGLQMRVMRVINMRTRGSY